MGLDLRGFGRGILDHARPQFKSEGQNQKAHEEFLGNQSKGDMQNIQGGKQMRSGHHQNQEGQGARAGKGHGPAKRVFGEVVCL